MSDDLTPQWLTSGEAADLLRIKTRTLYHLVAKGRVPHTRAGGKLLFTREQLLAWLAGQSESNTQPASHLPAVIAGSHDPLLEWAVNASQCDLTIDAQGSSDGLDKLARRQACAALIHVPDTDGNGFNRQALTNRTAGLPIASIRWARREQGLLVAQGNPLQLTQIEHLTRAAVRMVLRQAGAGSNLLLGKLLMHASITLNHITVLEPRASSETALALAIANDQADVGFGIRAAAIAGKVQFVPLVWEEVDLAFWHHSYFEPALQALLTTMQSPHFNGQAKRLTGYDLTDTGSISFNA